ncbi:HAD family hydrolase [Nocardioides campestrisoli]|uniref:HAD family hydrolase n=1 Tax=Nocardioides campestrisoli TaxID=2736757 RepID=UPI0037CBFE2A
MSTDFPAVAAGPESQGGEAALHAVLWDMDGTLVDTEPYWIETEFELARRYGGTWSHEHALNLVGNDLLESGRYIRTHMGIDLEPAQIVEELLDGVVARVEQAVPWRPGARELLAELTAAGVPCALVTMSYRRFVDPVLAQLPEGTFQALVTGDVVSRGKPHPEPYLTAAAALGVLPTECVAIEDSDTGARSAVAAGCSVLCVPNHVPIASGPGRFFAESLADISLDTLRRGSVSRRDPGHAAE